MALTLRRHVLVDTSAVYALIDGDDGNHETAVGNLERLRKRRLGPLLTNLIVAESHALLLARLGPALARRWLLGNTWRIERVTDEDERRACHIVRDFDDKSFSYCDATSFAVMDRLVIRRALAFDRHFEQYGFELIGSD